MRCYDLGLYEKSMPNTLSLREKLEAAKQAGFDYLELSIDETQEKLSRLDWTPEEVHRLWLDQRQTGVPIRSICLSGHRSFPMGHPDPEIRQKSQEILEKAVDLASALGIRLIQLAGYDVYYEPSTPQTRQFFAQGLRTTVAYAARRGVMLGFETMETQFMNTVQKAMFWVDEIRSPYLQIYPDMGNLTNAAVLYQYDVCQDIALGRGHFAAAHLKETRPGVFREVPFGEGHVDFPTVARCCLELGVRQFVGEFWYAPEGDWKQVLADNNRFLRSALDTAVKDIAL